MKALPRDPYAKLLYISHGEKYNLGSFNDNMIISKQPLKATDAKELL